MMAALVRGYYSDGGARQLLVVRVYCGIMLTL
jgi:hypothetical protein